MDSRRSLYATSLNPGWSDSSSAPASSVLVEKRSMSEILVGNHGTTAACFTTTPTHTRRSSARSVTTCERERACVRARVRACV